MGGLPLKDIFGIACTIIILESIWFTPIIAPKLGDTEAQPQTLSQLLSVCSAQDPDQNEDFNLKICTMDTNTESEK